VKNATLIIFWTSEKEINYVSDEKSHFLGQNVHREKVLFA